MRLTREPWRRSLPRSVTPFSVKPPEVEGAAGQAACIPLRASESRGYAGAERNDPSADAKAAESSTGVMCPAPGISTNLPAGSLAHISR